MRVERAKDMGYFTHAGIGESGEAGVFGVANWN
jgi:hypothetical protein